MTAIGPWLVAAGAALVVVCAVLVLVLALNVLRRKGAEVSEWEPSEARSRLADAAARGATDEELVRLALAAAVEAAAADAAAIVLRREAVDRTGSANLDERESRFLLEELSAADASPTSSHRYEFASAGGGEPTIVAGVRTPLTVPGGRPAGTVGVYWHGADGAPERAVARLEEVATLVAAVAPSLSARAAPPLDVGVQEPGEMRRLRRVAAFAGTVELPELLRKLLDTTAEVTGADAAVVGIPEPGPDPLHVSLGLSALELEWIAAYLAVPAEVATITRYVALQAPLHDSERQIATTILVPVSDDDGEAVGNLVAAWRRDLGAEADRRLAELEQLVEDLRGAVGSAIRFHRLQELSVRDAETRLFNRRYFLGALADACARSEALGAPLSVVLVTADEADADSADAAVARAADSFAEAVGEASAPSRIGVEELGAVLPGTRLEAAETLLETVLRALRREEPQIAWAGAVAERAAGEPAGGLYQRARRGQTPRHADGDGVEEPGRSP